MPRKGASGSTIVSVVPLAAERISMFSRFSSTARCRWYGPAVLEAGRKWFSSSRSKIATARSCSISGLRRTTVCSSRVMPAIRQAPFGSAFSVDSPAMRRWQPDRHRQGVRLQPLRLGEADRRWGERGKARGIAADERGALEEVENPEARGEPCAARSRQYVVGPGNVIANCLRRVPAEKDRTGMTDPLGQRLGIVQCELEMLGSDPVDQQRRLFPIVDNNDRAVRLPARPSDLRR